uniref:Uncharacterized protein n=1 Tax=Glossina pallidipes TaxID=7398 RepID=A0A1A9Z735_GLOPL
MGVAASNLWSNAVYIQILKMGFALFSQSEILPVTDMMSITLLYTATNFMIILIFCEIKSRYASLSQPQGFNNITKEAKPLYVYVSFDKYLMLACRGNINAVSVSLLGTNINKRKFVDSSWLSICQVAKIYQNYPKPKSSPLINEIT